MEIKLVARVIGAEEQTNTRQAFWEKLKAREAVGEPSITENQISEYERAIYVYFPQRLKEEIKDYIRKELRFRPTHTVASVFRPFRRRSVLGDDFVISVKSLRYG